MSEGLIMYDPAHKHLANVLQLCEEKGIDADVTKEIIKAQKLIEDRENYCHNMSSDESDARKSITDFTFNHDFDGVKEAGKSKWKLGPYMMSSKLEGTFLQSVISMSRAKSVLEIGMFTGYAALSCAEALPVDGRVVTCEFDSYLEPVARELFDKSPHGKKIQIRMGDAHDTLVQLTSQEEQFDVIFIDADKTGYLNYFKSIIAGNLLAPGGTILFDNAFFGGYPFNHDAKTNEDGEAIKECNEYLKSQPDLHRVLIPVRDGIMMVRRMSETITSPQ